LPARRVKPRAGKEDCMAGFIGVSAAETARFTDFWDSFVHVDRPPDTRIEVARGANIARNRNGLTEHALAAGAEWVWFVDDDQVFAPEALTRLLSHDRDIVSGLYVARDVPFKAQIFDRVDAQGKAAHRLFEPADAGLVQILAAGAGSLLVKRRVLEGLSAPYWTLGQIAKDEWGDDLDFCHRARAAGFDIWCDLDCYVGHKIQATLWPQRTEQGWVTTLVASNQPVAHFPSPRSPLALSHGRRPLHEVPR
jgi:hypothetical protein